MKRPWSDGTTHVLFSPQELIERLVALIPPPRANLVRYHGVLAPNAKSRKFIVPKQKSSNSKTTNMTWAEMLKRVFLIDATKCQFCGGELKFIATIIDAKTIKAILESMDLPTSLSQFRNPLDRAPPGCNPYPCHHFEESQLPAQW